MKKYFSLLMALIFLVGGGACVTNSLYQKNTSYRVFEEEVSTFLITQDGKQLIVAGKNRHYIFEPNATLKFILTWSQGNLVNASFGSFEIDGQQRVSGEYALTIEANNQLSAETKNQLLKNGFVYNTSTSSLSYKGTLKGKCYDSGGMVIPKAFRFHHPFKVSIKETLQQYNSSTTERILLTPLTVTADGVIFAVGVPVIMLMIPFGILN